MQENCILVDEADHEIGTEEKMATHERGLLHRAFSVFVFNASGELLLQQRAFEKYHSGGLWTNTCCSHPRPGEETSAAAHRRLQEEMGFDCPLKGMFTFRYRAPFSNGLTENEVDHVFFGNYDGPVNPVAAEVASTRWIGLDALEKDLDENAAHYSVWLRECFTKIKETRT